MLRRITFATLVTFATLPGHATPFWGATGSPAPETAPVDLEPGEFVWNAAATPAGPIVVLVSLGEQRAYVYRNGIEARPVCPTGSRSSKASASSLRSRLTAPSHS